MATNVSRGAAAKARTKKWLLAVGYQVADLEKVHWIFTPGGRMPIKRDQLGADLLAVSSTAVVFVQVKSGESARTGTFPAARRAFEVFTFPASVQLWIVAWPPRARAPRVVMIEPVRQQECYVKEDYAPETQQQTLEQQETARRALAVKAGTRRPGQASFIPQGRGETRLEFELDRLGETGDRLAAESSAAGHGPDPRSRAR